MKCLIQRVNSASVEVDKKIVGKIGQGVLIFLGVFDRDTGEDIDYLVEKILNLRIFPGQKKEFDFSLRQIKGEILVVSQFTLCASTAKGRRPDFSQAAESEKAKILYELFVEKLTKNNLKIATGQFGKMMKVDLQNSGPATFILNSVQKA
ncbi:MAG TPA: D-aminoacyl-tRNA deacylase [Patescibacteria group bacterium]|nr:D-aminoacyl-tRNA deacylase [Patescibacteria group bacterium]